MKRSLLLSAALFLAGAFGLGATPAGAADAQCYVDGPNGLEEAPNFDTQQDCETLVAGYWL